MGATAKTIAGRFGWIISLSQLGDPGQVLRSFRLRFELIQFSSKTRSFPSVGVTAIPTVKETIPPAQAVKWIFVFPIRQGSILQIKRTFPEIRRSVRKAATHRAAAHHLHRGRNREVLGQRQKAAATGLRRVLTGRVH